MIIVNTTKLPQQTSEPTIAMNWVKMSLAIDCFRRVREVVLCRCRSVDSP